MSEKEANNDAKKWKTFYDQFSDESEGSEDELPARGPISKKRTTIKPSLDTDQFMSLVKQLFVDADSGFK